MICLPQISMRRWPMVRAMRSVDAPGVNGTTQRIGFEGKLSTDSDFSAAMHALAQHNDNASSVVFIGRLHELSSYGDIRYPMKSRWSSFAGPVGRNPQPIHDACNALAGRIDCSARAENLTGRKEREPGAVCPLRIIHADDAGLRSRT